MTMLIISFFSLPITMDALQKMTASHICRSISAGIEGISDIITNDRIDQIVEDPITLTTHLKSRPVQWKHISENLEMTVAAIERRPASILQHPLGKECDSWAATCSICPRLNMIKAVLIRNRNYVAEMSQS